MVAAMTDLNALQIEINKERSRIVCREASNRCWKYVCFSLTILVTIITVGTPFVLESCRIPGNSGDTNHFLLLLGQEHASCVTRYKAYHNLQIGEVGDFLAGVFAPLALIWFSYSVMLQAHQVNLQRLELKEATMVSIQQHHSLRMSAEIHQRTLFLELMAVANRATDVQSARIYKAVCEYVGQGSFGGARSSVADLLDMSENMLSNFLKSSSCSKNPVAKNEIEKQLKVLIDRYDFVRESAERSGSQQFLKSVHHLNEYGRLERTARDFFKARES